MLRLDWSIVNTLIVKGVPMGLQLFVISLSGMLMITLVNRFGVHSTAAFGAAFQVWTYIQMPAFADRHGGLVDGGAERRRAEMGSRERDRGRRLAVQRAGDGLVVLVVECWAALCWPVPPGRLGALAIARASEPRAAWSFILLGVSMVLFGVVRATGAVLPPLLILSFSLLCVRFAVRGVADGSILSADAIWWSFPTSSIVALALSVAYYRYGNWRSARMAQRLTGSPSTALIARLPHDTC